MLDVDLMPLPECWVSCGVHDGARPSLEAVRALGPLSSAGTAPGLVLRGREGNQCRRGEGGDAVARKLDQLVAPVGFDTRSGALRPRGVARRIWSRQS